MVWTLVEVRTGSGLRAELDRGDGCFKDLPGRQRNGQVHIGFLVAWPRSASMWNSPARVHQIRGFPTAAGASLHPVV